jgi:RNA polymerase sigma-70 factor (sigma-E family)
MTGVETAARDDDRDFRAFVHDQEPMLLKVASLLTPDPGLAADLVQTALTRTYSRWARLRDQNPAAYARRIVVNANVDRWRRDRGRERLTDHVPERSTGDVADAVADRDALARAMADLTLAERRVVALRFLVDLSEADTAAELGLPLGTVKSTTHRAVTKLRTSQHLHALNEGTP